MIAPPKALIFDVFGTLVDWRSSVSRGVAAAFEGAALPVAPDDFADLWRGEYQPSMAPIISGARPYQPLDVLHRENLDRLLDRLDLAAALSEAEKSALTRIWERLDPWPDVPFGLIRLREHALIAPCSNGSIALMSHLARHANLSWDAILGAEIARSYKPDPKVYRASAAAFQLPPHQVMMVAAHNDDLAAAQALGFQTVFIYRATEHGPAQTTDLSPSGDWDIIANDLNDLANQLFDKPDPGSPR